MSITVLFIALLGTIPVWIVWFMQKKEWLIPAIILSILIAVGTGSPAFAIIDLSFVGIASYIVYMSMEKHK